MEKIFQSLECKETKKLKLCLISNLHRALNINGSEKEVQG